jgi:hypothetical protein
MTARPEPLNLLAVALAVAIGAVMGAWALAGVLGAGL